MNYLLGIDFGGGASKAVLIDQNGGQVAEHTVEYPTYHPKPGWCEQQCEDWIRALIENIKGILEKSRIRAGEISAVALDSATHTWIMCDDTFRPIRPAIHWTDSRSRKQSAYLEEHDGDFLFAHCFHHPDTIWTLPQLLWVKENEPDNYRKLSHIFFEKDYIRYWLTGVYGTDRIEAQGSMLFDYEKGEWLTPLLELAGISEKALPPTMDPITLVGGGVTPEAAKITGLIAGTPVACGTTDTVLEVLACGAIHPGDMTVKLATAGRICVVTENPFPNRHLVNYSHIIPGLWYPGTATKSAAASYRWYRDSFGGDYEQLNEGAAKIPAGCDGLMFHPYLNGELTPYADSMLCGSFTGIRAFHTKDHFTRSVLEGVSLSLLHSKKTLESLSIPHGNQAVVLGGGAKGDLWRQITADCLGLSLFRTRGSDSSLGSAMLAGVASGIFTTWEDAVKACVKIQDITEPDEKNTLRYEKLFQQYVKLHDALAPIYRGRDL